MRIPAPASKISVDALYTAYASALRGFARSILRHEQDAEDIVQQVFINVLRTHGDGSGTHVVIPGRPERVLFAATRHAAITLLSRMNHPSRPKDEVPPQWGSPEESNDRVASPAASLRRLWPLLTPQQRTAFVLYRLQGLSQANVAAILEVSENAVKMLIRRAHEAIAKLLESGQVEGTIEGMES